MNRTLVISGGDIDKEFVKKYLKKNGKQFNNFIAVDRGLEFLEELEIMPNHVIGDFDSVNEKTLEKYVNTEIHQLQQEKDYTDTDMALRLAIKLKSEEIIVIGGIGTRLDHTIANIQNMKIALENNICCRIIDAHNEIVLINRTTKIVKDNNYQYISLLPLTITVTGITLIGFKYPLKNKTLEIGESIGISNEQIEDESIIEVKDGILIIIKSKD